MKYETIFRRLFDSAISAHQSTQELREALTKEREQILCDANVEDLEIHFSDLILQQNGESIVTAYLTRKKSMVTFGDIEAAGVVILGTNQRVLAFRYEQLGEPGVNQYTVVYVEGNWTVCPEQNYTGNHHPVTPFAIGDFSQTDKSLYYLLQCTAYGEMPVLKRVGRIPFPPAVNMNQAVFGDSPYDYALVNIFQQRYRKVA